MSTASAATFVDPSPFDLRATRDGGDEPAAALCVHGLTGTPYEVRPLAEAIARRGIRARGMLLPGHNSTPAALDRLPREAWVAAVRDEYRRLRAAHAKVFVVGLSLGGLLALDLASRDDVSALVVIGAPLRLRTPLPLLVPIVKHIHPIMKKRAGSDIRDPEARSRHPGYREMPLRSVHELIRLQRTVRAALAHVKAPTLVAHGAHDGTADPRDAERIHDGIGATEKEVVIYPESGHVVPVDVDGPELARRAAEFLVRRV